MREPLKAACEGLALQSPSRFGHLVTHDSGATQTTYNYPYAYGVPQPHGPTIIGTFHITHDLNGNQK